MRKTNFLIKIQVQRRIAIPKYNYEEMDLKKGDKVIVIIEGLKRTEVITFVGEVQAINRVNIPSEKFNKSGFEIGETVRITVEKKSGEGTGGNT